jgi:hypothetical protein
MKNRILTLAGASWLLAVLVSGAAVAAATLDSGGQRVTGGNVTIDGSLGGISGISTGTAATAKHGYIGQLTDVTNLTVTATPGSVNEGSSVQLAGLARLDDATALAVVASNIVWRPVVYPVSSLTTDGLATASIVYSNTTGVVTGAYLGIGGTGTFLVLDSNSDNWGLYAGDQIPDSWQVAYFGTNSPAGAAGSTNATGESNLYTFIADLNPTNPTSELIIVAVSNQVAGSTVRFTPSSTGRMYRLLYSTNLLAAGWTNLPGAVAIPGAGGTMSLSDTNTAVQRFYKIGVQLP